MDKNWNMIALCGNEQLRLALIAAKGEVVGGLAKGFPQFFLAEGEVHPRPNRTDFIRLIQEMERSEHVIQACKDAGLPYQRFSFSGHCNGETGGVPYAKGGYDTVANGWGDYFFACSKYQGGTLEHKGAEWIVVWNGYSSGDASSFTRHSLVIVPSEAFSA